MHTTADIARELPETVKGMIGRKIDKVEELDRRLLTVASVQGQEFDTVDRQRSAGARPGGGRGSARRARRDPPPGAAGADLRAARSGALAAVPVRARALSERALWIAAADAPGLVCRQGRPGARRASRRGGAGARRGARAAVRDRARVRHQRAVLLRGRAAGDAHLRVPRGAVARGARARSGRSNAGRPRAHAAGARRCKWPGAPRSAPPRAGRRRTSSRRSSARGSSVTSSAIRRRSFRCSGPSRCST